MPQRASSGTLSKKEHREIAGQRLTDPLVAAALIEELLIRGKRTGGCRNADLKAPPASSLEVQVLLVRTTPVSSAIQAGWVTFRCSSKTEGEGMQSY
nr:hypothetical protein [Planctomycetota bacterium]